ncbi:MAG: nucleotidyltransferase domain-containing protein [Candidatus Bathyarchaeia archaeon]
MQKKYTSSAKIFFPKFSKEQVIEEVGRSAKELREKLGLEAVILFGSYAKGSQTAASDIDLLIIFNNEKISENEVYKTLMKSIKLPGKELHLIPRSELENYEKTKWIKTIREEGIKIL